MRNLESLVPMPGEVTLSPEEMRRKAVYLTAERILGKHPHLNKSALIKRLGKAWDARNGNLPL